MANCPSCEHYRGPIMRCDPPGTKCVETGRPADEEWRPGRSDMGNTRESDFVVPATEIKVSNE